MIGGSLEFCFLFFVFKPPGRFLAVLTPENISSLVPLCQQQFLQLLEIDGMHSI